MGKRLFTVEVSEGEGTLDTSLNSDGITVEVLVSTLAEHGIVADIREEFAGGGSHHVH